MPVSQLAEPCWVLGEDDGRDFIPHFPSGERAKKWVRDNEPEALATIKPLDEPCWIAVCDGPVGDGPFGVCEEEFEDDKGGSHGPSRTVTEEWITGCGWKVARDSRSVRAVLRERMPTRRGGRDRAGSGQLTLDGHEVTNG